MKYLKFKNQLYEYDDNRYRMIAEYSSGFRTGSNGHHVSGHWKSSILGNSYWVEGYNRGSSGYWVEGGWMRRGGEWKENKGKWAEGVSLLCEEDAGRILMKIG